MTDLHGLAAYHAGDYIDLVIKRTGSAMTMQPAPGVAFDATPTDAERPTVSPGSYKQARGIIPWQDGDEPAEVAIRRFRDGEAPDTERRIAALEAQVAELTRRLDAQDGGK